jgi:hypothetical protein
MAQYQKALEALTKPENEPINWLFGSVLREQAGLPRSHFLLDALEKQPTSFLASWNYWVREYRAALINPNVAPQKASADLRAGKTDAECKLIVDQFPDIEDGRVEEVLDGDVKIVLERADKRVPSTTGLQSLILTRIFEGSDKSGQLVIESAIKEEGLEFDLPEFQDFFVKALRVVADATPKFFGSAGGEGAKNVLFLNWEPPDILVSPQSAEYIQEKIKQLFADFNLDLELIISFQAPEVPVSVLRSAGVVR